MHILGIDPGSQQSGWVVYDTIGKCVLGCGIQSNERILLLIDDCEDNSCCEHMVIEQIGHYGTGMPAGTSVYDTCIWIGQFIMRWCWGSHAPYTLILHGEVRMALCGTMRAKTANIRRALYDRHGATGGGATPQVGTKKQPGPLYGIPGTGDHKLSALAVAVAFAEREKNT